MSFGLVDLREINKAEREKEREFYFMMIVS